MLKKARYSLVLLIAVITVFMSATGWTLWGRVSVVACALALLIMIAISVVKRK